MEQFIGKHPRIEAVDAFTGFCRYGYSPGSQPGTFYLPGLSCRFPGLAECIGSGVFNVVFTLFAGKAYAIFALLFGFTFYIQSDNLKRRGGDFGYRFLWRLVLLAGFATLNAAFSRPGMFCCCSSSRGSSCFLRATGATGLSSPPPSFSCCSLSNGTTA